MNYDYCWNLNWIINTVMDVTVEHHTSHTHTNTSTWTPGALNCMYTTCVRCTAPFAIFYPRVFVVWCVSGPCGPKQTIHWRKLVRNMETTYTSYEFTHRSRANDVYQRYWLFAMSNWSPSPQYTPHIYDCFSMRKWTQEQSNQVGGTETTTKRQWPKITASHSE